MDLFISQVSTHSSSLKNQSVGRLTDPPTPDSDRCEDDVEVRREAAHLMFALSLNELNKVDIVGLNPGCNDGSSTGDFATELVALARSDDAPCARSAVAALANLSENDVTHEWLLSWGADVLAKVAIEVVVPSDAEEFGNCGVGGAVMAAEAPSVSSREVGQVREVARCIANLAGNYGTHPKLLDWSMTNFLVRSLREDDAITTRFAALGLANLSGQVCYLMRQACFDTFGGSH